MCYLLFKICEDKSLDIGNLLLWKNDEKLVLLFPTKKHWRSPSKLTCFSTIRMWQWRVPVHISPLEIEKWIRNNIDSIGVACIKEDIQNAIRFIRETVKSSI